MMSLLELRPQQAELFDDLIMTDIGALCPSVRKRLRISFSCPSMGKKKRVYHEYTHVKERNNRRLIVQCDVMEFAL